MKKLLPAGVLALALAASPGGATTYVMPTDEALLGEAPVVARVGVLTVSPAPVPGVPSTDYIVLVERLIKGHIAGTTVVVRVPGGIGLDGWAVEIAGAPHFREGDSALLFLTPRNDGTYGILHLMLGAFHLVEGEGGTLALRNLTGTFELFGEGGDPARDLPSFVAWLEERAAGRSAVADYRFEDHQEAAPAGGWPSRLAGRSLRWFGAADSPSSLRMVDWRWHGSAVAGAPRAAQRAMAMWNEAAGLPVRYRLTGRSSSTNGLTEFDGLNVLLFEDPNDTIPGAFSCGGGGVVAISSPWFDPLESRRLGSTDQRAVPIRGADVVTNDGSHCLLARSGEARRRTFGHELGNTLGLN